MQNRNIITTNHSSIKYTFEVQYFVMFHEKSEEMLSVYNTDCNKETLRNNVTLICAY